MTDDITLSSCYYGISMALNLGLALLFFLPIIESFDRQIALSMLLAGSIFISFPYFWKKKISFDWMESVFLMMLTVFAVSTLFSWSIVRSISELFRYVAYFLIFVALRRSEAREGILNNFLVPAVIINSLILSWLFILYTLPAQTGLPLPWPLPSAYSMNLFLHTFGHNRISDILILALPIAMMKIFDSGDKKILWTVLVTIFFVMLLVSLGRGAMLSLSLAFIIWILFVRKEEKLAAFGLILGSVTLILLLVSFIYSNFLFPKIDGTPIKFIYKPILNENRPDFIYQAAKGFSLSPIFGTGLDTFRYLSKMYQNEPATWSWYTHNHFLEIFQETGILGGVLFLTLTAILLRGALKHLKGGRMDSFQVKESVISLNTNLIKHGLFIGLLASLFLSLLDYNWQYLSVFLFFWMTAAVFTSLTSNKGLKLDGTLPFIFMAVVFTAGLILPLNSDTAIQKADNLAKNHKEEEALEFLYPYYRMDRANGDIMREFSEAYKSRTDYPKAHFWYQLAIVYNPLDSTPVMVDDFDLYLQEAKSGVNTGRISEAVSVINLSSQLYPPFYFAAKGNQYFVQINNEKNHITLKNKLREYITTAEQLRYNKFLSPEEIQLIRNKIYRRLTSGESLIF